MENRSLWVMTDELYNSYLHGIQATESDTITKDTNIINFDSCNTEFKESILKFKDSNDESTLNYPRNPRYSLTFRIVKKSKKLPSQMMNFLMGGKK